MSQRLSMVGELYVNSIRSSGILHVGDNAQIRATSLVLAVQRQQERFNANEGSFRAYPIFSRPTPFPTGTQSVTMSVDNLGSVIQVGRIRTLAVAFSSVIQIGSTCNIGADTRVKHFRQFLTQQSLPGGTAAAAPAGQASPAPPAKS